MGINPIADDMIRGLKLPSGFTVIELGDQFHHTGYRRRPGWSKRPAKEFYRELGCSRYESIDANGGGTIFADLNEPLDPHPGQFDLVTDFGTSEHCWDFAQVWRTIHSMCKAGGIIVFEKPYQGFVDHGFYSLHRTLFIDLARSNKYEILQLKEYDAERGSLWRGIYRKGNDAPFLAPIQGKYVGKLKKIDGRKHARQVRKIRLP